MTDERNDETQPVADAQPLPEPEPAPEAVTEPEPVVQEKEGGLNLRVIGLGIGAGVVAVAIVLLVLMLFAPDSSPIRIGAAADAVRAREEAEIEKVASRFATSLFTFDYKTIDDDLEAIQSDSTGSFSKELNQVLGEVDVFKEAIVEARGESVGQVQGIDVREVGDATASVRAFVVQAIRNKKNPEPREQVSGIDMTLVKTPDGWRVDGVQQFLTGAPTGATER
jgi:hypothetical protein